MNHMRLLSSLLICLALGLPVHAEEIYKHVDERGRVTYSNKPIKGGKKVDLPEVSSVPFPKEKPAAAKPKAEIDRELRRAELKAEIAKEEQALTDAKQAYKEGEEKPEVWKHTKTVTGLDGKSKQVTETGRNVAAFEEKMKKLQQEVDAHESRLQRLKADLVNLDAKKEDKKP